MKKIISALTLFGFLGLLFFPLIASAIDAPGDCCLLKKAITLETVTCDKGSVAAPSSDAAKHCSETAGYCENSKATWGMYCLMNTLYSITDWIFIILVGVASLFVVIGAFILLTSAGAPEKVTSGRNYILYAAIGLIVAMLARAVPAFVTLISGM